VLTTSNDSNPPRSSSRRGDGTDALAPKKIGFDAIFELRVSKEALKRASFFVSKDEHIKAETLRRKIQEKLQATTMDQYGTKLFIGEVADKVISSIFFTRQESRESRPSLACCPISGTTKPYAN
jgi:hypothetical protein